MATNMNLMISIIRYLKELARNEKNADTQESLEVAVQCLQTAYDLEANDPRLNDEIDPPPLNALYEAALLLKKNAESDLKVDASAEKMKQIGNDLMKKGRCEEAINYYTSAIDLDPKNAVYYCNRAAAYSRLKDFDKTIADCKKAIEIDSKYAKAYGRLGLAYLSQSSKDLAAEALKKAVELDPDNEIYKSNLKLAMGESTEGLGPGGGPGIPGLQNMNWSSLFNNPALRNMATTIMQDPNILSMFSGAGVPNAFNPSETSSVESTTTGSASGTTNPNNQNTIDMLLQAGQILAQQMQSSNPELVEQLRQRMNPPPNGAPKP